MDTRGLLILLAAGTSIGGCVIVFRAFRSRRMTRGAWYSVERNKLDQASKSLMLQAGVLFSIGALILLWLVLKSPYEPAIKVTAEPISSVTATSIPLTESTDNSIIQSPLPTPNSTSTPDPDLATIVPIEAPEIQASAIITNTDGGGLWLRDAPGGGLVQLLPEGSMIIVSGGLIEVDGMMWQAATSPDGHEGWVAADFLIYR
ncbi:MAG: hypothetical protein ABFQ89_00390 [Chloroflexota bacterium]